MSDLSVMESAWYDVPDEVFACARCDEVFSDDERLDEDGYCEDCVLLVEYDSAFAELSEREAADAVGAGWAR